MSSQILSAAEIWRQAQHFADWRDRQMCAELIKQGSKSFYTASWLLPNRVRQPAYALYGFCRLADDAVDELDDSHSAAASDARLAAVAHLLDRLDKAYRGMPEPHPVDRAFADVIQDFAIPRTIPEALIEGLLWDAEGRDYQNLPALLDYAARVASTVGVMMTLLMQRRDPETLARACDLGIAMQLTNIARDVGEDARAGRLYLPQDWLIEVGIDPDKWLAAPELTPEIKSVVGRLLQVADEYYDRAQSGIAALPLDCRPAIAAAGMIYAEIGRTLEGLGLDSLRHRAVVSKHRKLRLLAPACWRGLRVQAEPKRPPVAAAAFLVQAVEQTPDVPQNAAKKSPAVERTDWLIDFFARLKAREMGMGLASNWPGPQR